MRPGPAVLLFGAVVALTHHVGLLTDPLGTVGQTSWNDWLDLLVPLLVVGSAVLAQLAGMPDRLSWTAFVVGAIAYVEGHGLHLAANSVENRYPNPTAHLWDEDVSHVVWYAGLALLVVALVRAHRSTALRADAWGWLAAAGFGVTVATNAHGGGTVAGSLPFSLVMASYGVRRADPLGHLLAGTFGLAALTMTVQLAVG